MVVEKIIHSDDVQDINCCTRVLAGPGAGKTYWITGQIRQILESGNLGSTQKVACITYTNKAAQNVEERIGNGEGILEVSTIHAFLYAHVIKPFFHLIAEQENFDIKKLDGHDDEIIIGHDVLVNIVPHTKKYFAMSFKDFSSLKCFIGKYHWQYANNKIDLESSPNNKPPLLHAIKPRVSFGSKDVMLYKKYVWKEYGLMHHDDVLYFTYKLIKKYHSIIDFLIAKYPFILIDEYQDTNSIQHWIFQHLADAGAKITIIGDKAQSIYKFAGSDINNITSFYAPNLQCYRIEDNRRSVQPILDFLNIVRNDLNQKSLVEGDYGSPILMIGEAKNNYVKAKGICNQEELVSLSWNNLTANALKLDVSISGTNNMLNVLNDTYSSDKRTKFVLNCIMAVENAKSLLMKDAMNYIAKAFHLEKKRLLDKKLAFNNLSVLLAKEPEYRNKSLLDFYNVANDLLYKPLPKITSGEVKAFYSKDYLEFAKGVRTNDEETKHLTIHKAKGLEFDNVLLVFDEKEDTLDFLLNTNLNETKDDHRLYYVACSRAKHRLFISIPSLNDDESIMVKRKYNDSLKIE